MEEIRKDIAGYEGLYQVSNFGNVKSAARCIQRNKMGPINVKEKILKPVIRKGYHTVSLCNSDGAKIHRISRLVAAAFLENPDNSPIVMHINNDTNNNHYSNLKRGTASQNIQQAYDDGLAVGPKPWLGKFGAEHCRSKSYNGILAPLQ